MDAADIRGRLGEIFGLIGRGETTAAAAAVALLAMEVEAAPSPGGEAGAGDLRGESGVVAAAARAGDAVPEPEPSRPADSRGPRLQARPWSWEDSVRFVRETHSRRMDLIDEVNRDVIRRLVDLESLVETLRSGA
jgi:RecA/RadA recombinase